MGQLRRMPLSLLIDERGGILDDVAGEVASKTKAYN